MSGFAGIVYHLISLPSSSSSYYVSIAFPGPVLDLWKYMKRSFPQWHHIDLRIVLISAPQKATMGYNKKK